MRYTEKQYIEIGGRGGLVIQIQKSSPGIEANTIDKIVLIRYGAEGYCEIQFIGKTEQWYKDHGVVEHQMMDLR